MACNTNKNFCCMGLSMDIVNHLKVDVYRQGIDSLSWNEVSDIQYQLLKQSGMFDIDYVLVHVDVDVAFSTEAFLNIFGSCQGKFLAGSFMQKIYSEKFKKVLTFAECGEYRLALPLTCAEGEDIHLLAESQKSLISQKLSDVATNGSFSFTQFRLLILEKFSRMEFVIFRFGQKETVNSFAEKFFPSKSCIKYCEGAVAGEFSLANHVLYPSIENRVVSRECFSMFLSTSVCNLLLKRREAHDYIKNSYRLCTYNTSQHKRSHVRYKLNTEDMEHSKPEDELDSAFLVKESVLKNLENFSLFVRPAFKDSRLRVEAYLKFDLAEESLKELQRSIAALLKRKIKVMKRTEQEIDKFIEVIIELSKRSAKLHLEGFSRIFVVLYPYSLVVEALFGVKKLSKTFLQMTRGFGIHKEHVNEQAYLTGKGLLEMQKLFVSQISPILPEPEQQRFYLVSIFKIELLIESLRSEDQIDTKNLESEIEELLMNHGELLFPVSTGDFQKKRKLACLIEFLKVLVVRTTSKIKQFLLMKLIFLGENFAPSFRNTLRFFLNRKLSTVHRGTCYEFLEVNIRTSMKILSDYVNRIDIHGFIRSLDRDEDDDFILIVKKFLSSAELKGVSILKKASKNLKNLQDQGVNIYDNDAIARMFYMKYPDKQKGFTSVLDASISEEDFVSYLTYLTFLVSGSGKIMTPIQKLRDNLTKKTLLLGVTAGQMAYCTGIFAIKSRPAVISVPLPERCEIVNILPVSARPALLGDNLSLQLRLESNNSWLMNLGKYLFDEASETTEIEYTPNQEDVE